MSGAHKAEPLVAVVCRVPLIGEAVTATLEGIADVRRFPSGRADIAGLLRALAPDAVIVDTEEEASEAEAFARETESPLLQVSLANQTLRIFEHGHWHEAEEAASPEAIRNAVVGGMYGRTSVK